MPTYGFHGWLYTVKGNDAVGLQAHGCVAIYRSSLNPTTVASFRRPAGRGAWSLGSCPWPKPPVTPTSPLHPRRTEAEESEEEEEDEEEEDEGSDDEGGDCPIFPGLLKYVGLQVRGCDAGVRLFMIQFFW